MTPDQITQSLRSSLCSAFSSECLTPLPRSIKHTKKCSRSLDTQEKHLIPLSSHHLKYAGSGQSCVPPRLFLFLSPPALHKQTHNRTPKRMQRHFENGWVARLEETLEACGPLCTDVKIRRKFGVPTYLHHCRYNGCLRCFRHH